MGISLIKRRLPSRDSRCITLRAAAVVAAAATALVAGAQNASAQAISPSAGCTAVNNGDYDLFSEVANEPVTLDFTDDFVEGEVLTFTASTSPSGGGFETATADDTTAPASILDTTTEASADYTIPETGARDFSLVLETESDFPNGAIELTCAPAEGDITIVKMSDVDGDFDFTGDLGDFTISHNGEPGFAFFPGTAAGSYTVTELAGEETELESIVCEGDGDEGSVISVVDGEVVIDLDAGEDITCTFTNGVPSSGGGDEEPTDEEIDEVSRHVIRNFLYHRASELLNSEPDRARIIRKSPGLLWTEATDLSIRADGNGVDANFATSTAALWSNDFDLWIEGHFTSYRYDNDARSEGDFGIVYVGADYLLSEDFLVGVLGQFDWMEEETEITGEAVDGDGWMVGPYISARLDEHLFFDARAAWGQSSNTLDIEGLVSGDMFDTERWLIRGALTGNKQMGRWRFTPTASVAYIEEKQDAYVSGTGAMVSGQTVALGRAVFEPEIAYRHVTESGVLIEPQFSLGAVWDFESPDGLSIPGWNVSTDDFRLRTEAGLMVVLKNGLGFRATGAYDGIAAHNYRSYSGRVWLDIPFGGRRSRPAPPAPQLKRCADGTMVAAAETCPTPAPDAVEVGVAFKPGKAALTDDGVNALDDAWSEASAYDVAEILVDPATDDEALAAQRLEAIRAALGELGAPAEKVRFAADRIAAGDVASIAFELY